MELFGLPVVEDDTLGKLDPRDIVIATWPPQRVPMFVERIDGILVMSDTEEGLRRIFSEEMTQTAP